MKLKGRTAIVTGGGSGIGKELARRLAADGANIVIADIRGQDEVAKSLDTGGVKAVGIKVDVSSEEDTARMAAEAMAAFGRIDILVNNAAMFSVITPGPFEQIAAADWKRMMEVNTMGPFLCSRAVAPHMRKAGGGRIINLCSGTVWKGVPFMLHYVTSKGAILAFTRALARELGPDKILVNAIAPGLTLSEGVLANPVHNDKYRDVILKGRSLQRDQYPEDLVGAVSFFAGDDSAFVTGQCLVIDGGSSFN